MRLFNLLSRFERLALASSRASKVTRIGDVLIATGVANDLAPPANDEAIRPHIVARRSERRARRDVRSA